MATLAGTTVLMPAPNDNPAAKGRHMSAKQRRRTRKPAQRIAPPANIRRGRAKETVLSDIESPERQAPPANTIRERAKDIILPESELANHHPEVAAILGRFADVLLNRPTADVKLADELGQDDAFCVGLLLAQVLFVADRETRIGVFRYLLGERLDEVTVEPGPYEQERLAEERFVYASRELQKYCAGIQRRFAKIVDEPRLIGLTGIRAEIFGRMFSEYESDIEDLVALAIALGETEGE